jgi:RNA polymerase sigma-70 factor (ECF subfamily)
MKPNAEQIEQAVKDFQAGKDREENFRLIDEYLRPRLTRYFASQEFPPDLREDLTQEVFILVSESMTDFRGGDSIKAFNTWVYRIAENKGRDYRRSQGTKKREGQKQTASLDDRGDNDEDQPLPLDPLDPSQTSRQFDELLDKEHQQLLREAVERLPRQMRNCIRLRCYENQNNQEIATLMRLSVETVKAHLRKAIEKLKADLESD